MRENHNKNGIKEHVVEVCPNCDGKTFDTERTEQSFPYGEEGNRVELVASFPVHTCRQCGYQFTDESAEETRHEAVCRYLAVMTPADIVRLREKYSMSRGQLAELSRLGPASIARWEAGIVIQNAGNDQLLYLLQFEDNLARLRERAGLTAVPGQTIQAVAAPPLEVACDRSLSPLATSNTGRRPHRCPLRARPRELVDVDGRRELASRWSL